MNSFSELFVSFLHLLAKDPRWRGSEVYRPHFLILHNAGRHDEKGIIKQSGGRGFRVLRTRPTSTSCTRHCSQRSQLLYHYCPQILPLHLPSTLLPFPSPFLGCLRCQASSVQTMYTRGNNKRNGTKKREKETNDERELFSRQKPRHFLSETSWTRFILSSLSESLSDIPPFYPLPPCPKFLADSLWTCPATGAPASPAPHLTPIFQPVLPRRVLSSSFSPSCPAGATSNTRINHAQTFPRSGHARPINYSVGAVDPPSLFRLVHLSLGSSSSHFHLPAQASRRGSGMKFILQIYSFIYCERLFTPVRLGRITIAKREMYHTLQTIR